MHMTLAQFDGLLAAVVRAEKRRFLDACAAVRIGGTDEKSYRSIVDKLEKD